MPLFAQDAEQEVPIPEKLLDAPIVNPRWPSDGFNEIGYAMRLDYTTDLHPEMAPLGDQDPEDPIRFFKHKFLTGVKIYWPFRDDLGELDQHFGGEPHRLPQPFDPIMLGYNVSTADRIYFQTRDGRQVIAVRDDLDVEPIDRKESFAVIPLDPSIVAWDPENLQLLILPKKGTSKKEPLFVIRGGGLNMSMGGSKNSMVLG